MAQRQGKFSRARREVIYRNEVRETVEQYLKRGGKITKIAHIEACDIPVVPVRVRKNREGHKKGQVW